MPDDIDAAMTIAHNGDALDWPTVALTLAGEVKRLRIAETSLRRELGRVYGYLARAEEERDALWESVTALRMRIRDDAHMRGMALRARGILAGTDARFGNPLHKMVARYVIDGR